MIDDYNFFLSETLLWVVNICTWQWCSKFLQSLANNSGGSTNLCFLVQCFHPDGHWWFVLQNFFSVQLHLWDMCLAQNTIDNMLRVHCRSVLRVLFSKTWEIFSCHDEVISNGLLEGELLSATDLVLLAIADDANHQLFSYIELGVRQRLRAQHMCESESLPSNMEGGCVVIVEETPTSSTPMTTSAISR